MGFPSSARLHEDSWSLIGTDASLGPTIGGVAQVVGNITPLWSCEVVLMFRTQRSLNWLEYEAWRSARRGRLISDDITPDRDRVMFGDGFVTFDGDVTFDDGSGFSGVPAIETVAAASQYSNQVTIDAGSEWFVPGRFFWINDQMVRATIVSGSDITFEPPLRAAAPIGSVVEGYGTIAMILAQSEDGVLRRTRGPTSDVNIRMVEAT